MPTKTKKRPCAICRKWFTVSLQARTAQTVCGETSCQRERHRRACAAWHLQNPDYDKENRLRRKLQAALDEPARPPPRDELPREFWKVARDADSLEASVIVEVFGRVLVRLARDADLRQVRATTRESGKVLPESTRDGSDHGPAPP